MGGLLETLVNRERGGGGEGGLIELLRHDVKVSVKIRLLPRLLPVLLPSPSRPPPP